jgi:hypothetical protein
MPFVPPTRSLKLIKGFPSEVRELVGGAAVAVALPG